MESGQEFDLGLYKKFYDVWVRSSSEMLNEMMRSPQFAGAMGKSLHSSLDFKKRMDEVIESSLKGFHFPTSSEVTELSRQIRGLERQVHGFSQRLEDLKSDLKSRSNGSATRKQPSSKKKQ